MGYHKRVVLLITLALTILSSTISPTVEAKKDEWTKYKLIAHALGGIDGYTYTNSLEALLQNYQKGHRVFEVDLILTEDGHLVARHDWTKEISFHLDQKIPKERLGNPLTLKEFKTHRINQKYTPLTIEDIFNIMIKYPDIYIVTDTKETNENLIKKQFRVLVENANKIDSSVLDRVVPQIYNQEMLGYIEEIYNFKSIIYTLYQSPDTDDEVINFIKQHDNIDVITMPVRRSNEEFISKIYDSGIKTFVHTLNSVEKTESLMKLKVHGFYTDFLTYNRENKNTFINENQNKYQFNIELKDRITATIIGEERTVSVTLINKGNIPWSEEDKIRLSYHWLDENGEVIEWNGQRTVFPITVQPEDQIQVEAIVKMPNQVGMYYLEWDMVHEGVTWFSQVSNSNMSPIEVVVSASQEDLNQAYSFKIVDHNLPKQMKAGELYNVEVAIKNTSAFQWGKEENINLSYHWYNEDGEIVVFDGIRTIFPETIDPGDTINVTAQIQPPDAGGNHIFTWDIVHEGITWFSQKNKDIANPEKINVVSHKQYLFSIFTKVIFIFGLSILGLLSLKKYFPNSYLVTFNVTKRISGYFGKFVRLFNPKLNVIIFILGLYLKIIYFSNSIEIKFEGSAQVLTICMLLLVTAIANLNNSGNRRIGLFMLNTFSTLVIFADLIYWRYFNDFISINIFLQIGQVGELGGSIYELIKFTDLIFVIDLIVMFMIILLSKKTNENIDDKRNRIQKYGFLLLIFAITAIPIYEKAKEIVYKETPIYNNSYLNSLIVLDIGIINYHIYDLYKYVNDHLTQPNLGSEELQRINEWFMENGEKNQAKTDVMFGVAKNKNVLIIQEESLQEFVIGLEVNGHEVTPNLNKLIKESIYFNNYYDETFQGRTSDGEFTSLTSLFPLSSGSVFFRYPANEYDSLTKILSQNGYYTLSAHPNRSDFWNRRIMHKQLGFQSSMFEDDFVPGDKIGWGLSNHSFFDQMIDRLKEVPKPYMAFLITLSNHHPYDTIPEEYKQLDIQDLEGSLFGNYLLSVHYVDFAIGQMIEKLKKEGLYEETVVLIYGDHDAGIGNEVLKLKELKGPNYNISNIDKIPLVIHIPNTSHNNVNERVGGHVDFTPTLLHLLGIDSSNYYFMGQNLFADREDFVSITRAGSFNSQEYHYSTNFAQFENGHCFNRNDGKEVDKLECEKLFNESLRHLQISDQIIQGDLLPKLKSSKD